MWEISKKREDKELRKSFVETLDKIMENDPKVVLCEADLGGASGTTNLKDKYKKQFIQMGISEANMIGTAAGMSIRGYIPFIHTFAPFTTRRALDQIFISGAYAENTLNIYGSDPGFCAGANGGTHSTYDDISIMRSIPNTMVLAPADSVCFEWCINKMYERKGVNYVRGNRKNNIKIYEDGSKFELGKGNVLKKGEDVTIFVIGELVYHALEAADELEDKGISTEVIDMFSLKPFDRNLTLESLKNKKLAVSFENHNVIGGLGSIISETITDEGLSTKLIRIGVKERFGQVGTPEDQRIDYGLTKENIVNKVIESFKD